MRSTVTVLGALVICAPIPSIGAAADMVFDCRIGAKSVSVSGTENRLIYRFGTRGKAEMSIIGTPAAKNVFKMTQRFAGMEYQLRFTRGDTSYIVYSSEGNSRTDAAATSGLVVMRGNRRIADRSCAPFAAVSLPDRSRAIPEDDAAHSAM